MKRCCLSLALLFVLLISLAAGFLYCFDINDHSPWLSKQIEKYSGYQVNFERIDSAGWPAGRFSVSGLSVAVDKQMLLQIDKVHITIAEWHLWQRELQVELLELVGVELIVDADSLKKRAAHLSGEASANNPEQHLPWSKLQLNKLRIRAINADISNRQQRLKLRQASVSTDNLLIIEQNKLATSFWAGELQLALQSLYLQSKAGQTALLKELAVRAYFDLPAVQAGLTAELQGADLSFSEQAKVHADNSRVKLQLNRNQVRLTLLAAQLFSGELQLQAEASLAFSASGPPALSIEELTLLSLSAKDMRIKIPAWAHRPANKALHSPAEVQPLIIKTLFLKQVAVQNLTVSSESKQLPLTIKGLNAQLQDVYLVQNNQLLSLSEESKQTGFFTLQVAYLQWADSVSEQLQMAGSFADNKQNFLILKDLLMLEEK